MRHEFKARAGFNAGIKIPPQHTSPGGLYFSSDGELPVQAGDKVEVLPGGYFITREGEFVRKQITNSANNAFLINEYCEHVRSW